MSNISVTTLLRLGILTKEGHIYDQDGNLYKLNRQEEVMVIKRLRSILNDTTPEAYLRSHIFTSIFPDSIVYMLIRDNKHLLSKEIQESYFVKFPYKGAANPVQLVYMVCSFLTYYKNTKIHIGQPIKFLHIKQCILARRPFYQNKLIIFYNGRGFIISISSLL
jgi:hypothetical protein